MHDDRRRHASRVQCIVYTQRGELALRYHVRRTTIARCGVILNQAKMIPVTNLYKTTLLLIIEPSSTQPQVTSLHPQLVPSISKPR